MGSKSCYHSTPHWSFATASILNNVTTRLPGSTSAYLGSDTTATGTSYSSDAEKREETGEGCQPESCE
jgi:hypothetical protein